MKESGVIVISVVIVITFLVSALAVLLEPDPPPVPKIGIEERDGASTLDMLRTGEAGAVVIGEPYVSEALLNGYGHRYVNVSDRWSGAPGISWAYDEDWYLDTSGSDFNTTWILRALCLVQLQAKNWISNASNSSSANHTQMVNFARDLTGKSAQVIEAGLDSVTFDSNLSIPNYKDLVDRHRDLQIYGDSWNESGYAGSNQYANSAVSDTYLDWAQVNLPSVSREDLRFNGTVSLRVGYVEGDLSALPFWIAYRLGWYADLSMDITPFPFFGWTDVMDAFHDDIIDVGIVESGTALAYMVNENEWNTSSPYYNDARVRLFCNSLDGGGALLVEKDLEVESMRDLEGRTVGITGGGSTGHVVLLQMIAEDHAVLSD